MSRFVGSSDGLGILLEVQPHLTHAEFRLLFVLSDCPDGDAFRTTATKVMARHRFTRGELIATCAGLSAWSEKIGTLTVDHKRDLIEWRLP